MQKTTTKYCSVLIIFVIAAMTSCNSSQGDKKNKLLIQKWKWVSKTTPAQSYDSAVFSSVINFLKVQAKGAKDSVSRLAIEEKIKKVVAYSDSANTWFIEFKSDSTYEETILNKLKNGKWSLKDENKTLEMIDNTGKNNLRNVIKLTSDTLILADGANRTTMKATK